MVPSKLTFAKYTDMDEQQRRDYAESWLYIRRRSANSQTKE